MIINIIKYPKEVNIPFNVTNQIKQIKWIIQTEWIIGLNQVGFIFCAKYCCIGEIFQMFFILARYVITLSVSWIECPFIVAANTFWFIPRDLKFRWFEDIKLKLIIKNYQCVPDGQTHLWLRHTLFDPGWQSVLK